MPDTSNVGAMPPNTVPVDVEYLEKLQDDALMLKCLNEAGVDNWEGYDVASRAFNKALEEIEAQMADLRQPVADAEVDDTTRSS